MTIQKYSHGCFEASWMLKVSSSSVARFVVLFVMVDFVSVPFHFFSDNNQRPEDTFDLILEKSPLERF